MLQRELELPPRHVYPPDPWRLVERRFYPRRLAQFETLFSVSNGYLGLRGNFDEGAPAFQNATLVNGFHETWPIVYGERAYGFAKTGQTILNVADAKVIKLYVADEPFYLPTASLLEYERALDMRAGTLDRRILWETPAGKVVSIKSRRLVSFEHRHLAAIEYEVTVVNAEAPVVISSKLVYDPESDPVSEEDPRVARGFEGRVLLPRHGFAKGHRIALGHQACRSGMTLGCAVDHVIETECPHSCEVSRSEDEGKLVLTVQAKPDEPIRLVKYMSYHTSRRAGAEELCERSERTLDRAVGDGFDRLLEGQRKHLDDFWERADVHIEAEPDPNRSGLRSADAVQQILRLNLFHIFQASTRAEGVGVPAKGLTGLGYEGHYFWDTEMYVLPFLIYTAPRVAKNLLKFRFSMLDAARERAREVNQKGALFAWRTINGEEASAYYAAGTAQYHINADVVYALRKYVQATGDEEFLFEVGAEVLVETARLWRDLGFFAESHQGRFSIVGVTGPDEYNTVVNDNAFTNLMARENLWFAADTVERMQRERPGGYEALQHRTGLDDSEIRAWREAADAMYLPYDEESGIHLQDDEFLDRKPWDFENTPPEKYPLLLHFHPLVIYRHRVIKQADIALAMFLLGDEFSLDQKKRNFDFYDPLTTGDSSLSVSIQSILASEIGYQEKAVDYFRYAALMDYADVSGNVDDGLHIASMGGTWMAAIYGTAGFRDYDGRLSFAPRPPSGLLRMRFCLDLRGQRLEVDMTRDSVTYSLVRGSELVIQHHDQEVRVTQAAPMKLPLHARPAS
jgi:alpha,alpha-trehalose phosphorylase